MNENATEIAEQIKNNIDNAQEKIARKHALTEVITHAVEAVGYDENDMTTSSRLGFLPRIDSIREGEVSKTMDRYGNEGTLIKLVSVSDRGEKAETLIVSQGKGNSSVFEIHDTNYKEYILEPDGQVSVSSAGDSRAKVTERIHGQFTEVKPLVSTDKK